MKTELALRAAYAASAEACEPKRTFTKSSPGIPEYGGLWQCITSPNCDIARDMPTRLWLGMMPVVIRTSADILRSATSKLKRLLCVSTSNAPAQGEAQGQS